VTCGRKACDDICGPARQDRDYHRRLPRNRLAAAQALAAAGAAPAQIAGNAIGIAAHAVDEDQARRGIDLALETFGSVDILGPDWPPRRGWASTAVR
jgi:hypothetical protein